MVKVKGNGDVTQTCTVKQANYPLFVIMLGVDPTGIYNQRFVYGYLDLLSNAGGLLGGL